MTSSLVGSEMCIRDRHKREASINNYLTSTSFPESPQSPAPYTVCYLQAVSYTHLTLPTICSV
eukprot:12781941-Prorocentrum_lima.AAC.1